MSIYSAVKDASIIIIAISCLIWVTTKHDFQLIQLGEMHKNQFLLDKETGRVWQKVCDGEVGKIGTTLGDCNGALIWAEMYVTDLTPSNSRPALIYDYILQQREEAKQTKHKDQ